MLREPMGEEKLKKAVVAIDESGEGSHALQWALDFILRPGDAVVLLYSTVVDLTHRECKMLNKYRQICQTHGLEVACVVAEGEDPRLNICSAVARTKADVLIMSSDSYGSLKRCVNSESVKCPVLIVKKP